MALFLNYSINDYLEDAAVKWSMMGWLLFDNDSSDKLSVNDVGLPEVVGLEVPVWLH